MHKGAWSRWVGWLLGAERKLSPLQLELSWATHLDRREALDAGRVRGCLGLVSIDSTKLDETCGGHERTTRAHDTSERLRAAAETTRHAIFWWEQGSEDQRAARVTAGHHSESRQQDRHSLATSLGLAHGGLLGSVRLSVETLEVGRCLLIALGEGLAVAAPVRIVLDHPHVTRVGGDLVAKAAAESAAQRTQSPLDFDEAGDARGVRAALFGSRNAAVQEAAGALLHKPAPAASSLCSPHVCGCCRYICTAGGACLLLEVLVRELHDRRLRTELVEWLSRGRGREQRGEQRRPDGHPDAPPMNTSADEFNVTLPIKI